MKTGSTAFAFLVLLLASALTGCTGGGPSGTSSPATSPTPTNPAPTNPTIQVLPATYDFGQVTPGNVPAPLEVTISNSGNGSLNIRSIGLRTPVDPSFSIDLTGGSKPCGSASANVAAGDQCTVHITFRPGSIGAFTSTLQISSNDPTSPVLPVPVSGTSESIAALTVRINQLQTSCPSNEVTAYVSVTDQGGYPVTGLQASNFSVTQETIDRPVLFLTYVDLAYRPVAISAALDHSGSLTSQPVAFADMKTGFSSFFNALRTGDLGEVVKFASEIEVTQPFTTDKAKLNAAISAPFDKGANTTLYDAAFQITNDTALNLTGFRKAVIVATDGADTISAHSLVDVTSNAVSKNVPIFTIGIGAAIDKTVLEQMATATGGLYYEANTSQNLATIYEQLSSVLFRNQYILRFDQLVKGGVGFSSTLTVGASIPGTSGTGAATITSCN